MPNVRTDRQRELLEFIRSFVRSNESSPRLEEISGHFSISPAAAHKHLKALQRKGYLFFRRDPEAGFFIRLINRVGTDATVTEVVITGRVNRYGEVFDFPKNLAHFSTVLSGSQPDEIFALLIEEDIPEVSFSLGDFLLLDYGRKPLPNDVCLLPAGEGWLLIRVSSKTLDSRFLADVMASEYPIPEELEKDSSEKLLNWYPIAYDEDTHDYFMALADEENLPLAPISPEMVAATAIRLSRQLSF